MRCLTSDHISNSHQHRSKSGFNHTPAKLENKFQFYWFCQLHSTTNKQLSHTGTQTIFLRCHRTAARDANQKTPHMWYLPSSFQEGSGGWRSVKKPRAHENTSFIKEKESNRLRVKVWQRSRVSHTTSKTLLC